MRVNGEEFRRHTGLSGAHPERRASRMTALTASALASSARGEANKSATITLVDMLAETTADRSGKCNQPFDLKPSAAFEWQLLKDRPLTCAINHARNAITACKRLFGCFEQLFKTRPE